MEKLCSSEANVVAIYLEFSAVYDKLDSFLQDVRC